MLENVNNSFECKNTTMCNKTESDREWLGNVEEVSLILIQCKWYICTSIYNYLSPVPIPREGFNLFPMINLKDHITKTSQNLSGKHFEIMWSPKVTQTELI